MLNLFTVLNTSGLREGHDIVLELANGQISNARKQTDLMINQKNRGVFSRYPRAF